MWQLFESPKNFTYKLMGFLPPEEEPETIPEQMPEPEPESTTSWFMILFGTLMIMLIVSIAWVVKRYNIRGRRLSWKIKAEAEDSTQSPGPSGACPLCKRT